MTYQQYINEARKTATYPEELAQVYLTMGFVGERGEVNDKFKKLIRDKGWNPKDDPDCKQIGPEDRIEIALELGDVMWYVAMIELENLSEDNNVYIDMDMDKTYFENERFTSIWDIMKDLNMKTPSFWILDGEGCIQAISRIAHKLGFTMNEICQMNIEKLRSRQERNKLSGSGDHR